MGVDIDIVDKEWNYYFKGGNFVFKNSVYVETMDTNSNRTLVYSPPRFENFGVDSSKRYHGREAIKTLNSIKYLIEDVYFKEMMNFLKKKKAYLKISW